MKLTLILLVCFVGVSYQQGYARSPFHRYPSHPFLANSFDPNKLELSAKSAYDSELADALAMYDDDELVSSIPNVQARIPFNNARKAQKKFFITSVYPNSFFPFNFRHVTVTTLTSTTVSVTTSTAVLATVQTCLPASIFVTQAAPGGSTVLSTACGRRRRNIDQSQIRIDTQHDDSISPTGVLPLTASSVAPNFASFDHGKPELASSQTNIGEEQRQIFRDDEQNKRQRRGISLSVVTVTSTSTFYSFSTTTLKKTVNLSGPQQLSCMPSGFAVC